jgi:hypothetical protein
VVGIFPSTLVVKIRSDKIDLLKEVTRVSPQHLLVMGSARGKGHRQLSGQIKINSRLGEIIESPSPSPIAEPRRFFGIGKKGKQRKGRGDRHAKVDVHNVTLHAGHEPHAASRLLFAAARRVGRVGLVIRRRRGNRRRPAL